MAAAVAAREERRAAGHGRLDVRDGLGALAGRHHRAEVGRRGSRIAGAQRLRVGDERGHERVVPLSGDVDPLGRRTHLAGV
ncbi:MAG: hypothetical protein PGN13_11315, partial [Patulibacter minatonensis]